MRVVTFRPPDLDFLGGIRSALGRGSYKNRIQFQSGGFVVGPRQFGVEQCRSNVA